MSDYKIRKGKAEDIPDLMRLIYDLAVFEKAPEMVINNEEKLLEDWQTHKSFDFLVASFGKEIVGISLFYPRYSTWRGRCFYLEDLFVSPEVRGKGVGLGLLKATSEIAKEKGAIRLDWQVLDWNTPAVEFYEKEGAAVEKEWWNCKLDLS